MGQLLEHADADQYHPVLFGGEPSPMHARRGGVTRRKDAGAWPDPGTRAAHERRLG